MTITLLIAAAALAVGGTSPIDAALLAGLPETSGVLNVHGVTHACRGPALGAVLDRLGVPSGPAVRGAALARAVVLHAREGYAVLFSLGELDATLGHEAAFVATSCDGKPLAAEEGPYRLVLPGDGRPARSLRQLASIELR